MKKKQIRCSVCGGRGSTTSASMSIKCKECSGSGFVIVTDEVKKTDSLSKLLELFESKLASIESKLDALIAKKTVAKKKEKIG